MLPTVEFCGLEVSRLIIGGNPFSGFSHQSPERDEEMLDYYTVDRIKETLRRAESAGINTTILRSDAHIHRLLREYRNDGGAIQWIAQVGADSGGGSIEKAVDKACAAGAAAAYIHGGHVDQAFASRDAGGLEAWIHRIRSHGIPAGVAGHAPDAHRWVADLGIADFHAVCFYNCGSLHRGAGDKFDPSDPPQAVQAIRAIEAPCIGYKILGAGRVDAREGFSFALRNIKDGDVVNVGVYRGDNDSMVEENAAAVRDVLARREDSVAAP
jgi:hypothetical protein